MKDFEKKVVMSLKESLHETTEELNYYLGIDPRDRFMYKPNIRFLENKIDSLKKDLRMLGVYA